MDHSIMKEALEQMKKDMRGRVGKKLLSIEVKHHADEQDDETSDGEDEEDKKRNKDKSVKGDKGQTPQQRLTGISLLP